MTEPTYRYAQKADTPALVALIERAYRGEDAAGKWTSEAHLLKGPRTNDEEIEGLIAREETRFLVVEINGKLVGCCLLQGLPPESDTKVNAAYFGMFAVRPGLQGQGITVVHVDEEAKVRAFQRWAEHGVGDDVVVVVNLSDKPLEDLRIGRPAAGAWRLELNSDSSFYSDDFADFVSEDLVGEAEPCDGLDASASVSIAPYTVLIYSYAG